MDINEMNINDRISNLKNSPIYAMSLGSKELFHSNFWAWLMRRNPEFINTFFFKFESQKPSVEREEKHRDITIHTEKGSKNDKIYIIENKIKSLPYVEQLAKYQIEAGDAFEGGVIAALKDPNFDCEIEYTVTVDKKIYNVKVRKDENKYSFVIDDTPSDKVWRFLSYADIVSEIEKNNKNFDDPETHIINEYIKVTKEINDIIAQRIEDNKNVFSLKCPELHDLKDIYKKYKMSHFKEYLKKYLENYSELKIIQDYSHDANLSIFYERELKSGIRKRVGIQIEGKQYRRYAEFLDGDKPIDFEKYKKEKWFMDKENGYLNYGNGNKRQTGMRKNYCKYNNGIFVYQYWKIDYRTTYDMLARVIKDDMKIAKDLIGMDI